MTFQQTIFALLLAARGTSAILHKHLSFVPPFLEVDHFGKRTVGFEWDLTGVAKAMRNFVRLTPDQQARQYTKARQRTTKHLQMQCGGEKERERERERGISVFSYDEYICMPLRDDLTAVASLPTLFE